MVEPLDETESFSKPSLHQFQTAPAVMSTIPRSLANSMSRSVPSFINIPDIIQGSSSYSASLAAPYCLPKISVNAGALNNSLNINRHHSNESNVNQSSTPSGSRPHTPKRATSGGRTYTPEDLSAAVEMVIQQVAQPVEVIRRYNIPRRTFFRHLAKRRKQLGIPPKRQHRNRPF